MKKPAGGGRSFLRQLTRGDLSGTIPGAYHRARLQFGWHGALMWQWHIVYEGDQRPEDRKIGPRAYETTKERFRAAAQAGRLDSRAVSAMWVVDLDSEREDVILLHGRAPTDIHARHHAYLQRAGATSENR